MFGKKKAIVSVDGMMCSHCAAHVSEALSKIEGVSSVKVSLEEKKAIVTFKGELPEEKVSSAIAEAGYIYKGIVYEG